MIRLDDNVLRGFRCMCLSIGSNLSSRMTSGHKNFEHVSSTSISLETYVVYGESWMLWKVTIIKVSFFIGPTYMTTLNL